MQTDGLAEELAGLAAQYDGEPDHLMVTTPPITVGQLRSILAALRQHEQMREALEYIAEEYDAGRHDGLPEPCPAHDADTMFAIAHAVLSPI